MNKLELKKRRVERRKHHIRKRVFGSIERPRMTIFRSLNHIYAQIINDTTSETMVSASSLDKDVRALFKPELKKTDRSKLVGAVLAKRAVEKNIKKVAFDRNGFLYHGRVKALADGARENGLDF
jgi:large subunit ribosomal protein L18